MRDNAEVPDARDPKGGREPAQAHRIRPGDLAGARPAGTRVDEERSGARRRGLSRPPAQTWTSDRPEDRAEGECPTPAHAVARKTLGPPQRSLACAQVAG